MGRDVVEEGDAEQVASELWEYAVSGSPAEGQRAVAKVWDLAENVVRVIGHRIPKVLLSGARLK